MGGDYVFKTRKEFLRKLLIGTYNTERINCESNQIFIEGKSLFDKCDFTKINKWMLYKEGFVELFKTTFIKSNVLFLIDTNGCSCKPDKPKRGQVPFDKKKGISNAYSHLNTLGVNFAMFGGADFIQVQNVEEIILHIINLILDFIFDKEIDIGCDEKISNEFFKLKSNIEIYLYRKVFSVANIIHTTTHNSVVDLNSKKENCNYFIPVRIHDLNIPYAVKIVASSSVAWIIKKKDKPCSYGEYNYEDYLLSELGVYDSKKDIVFDNIPFCGNEISETYNYLQSESFNISHICPDCSQVNEFVIYYLFEFSTEKLNVIYSDIETPYELRHTIISAGKKELSHLFKTKLIKYYSDVMVYIEDVLIRILSVNLEKMITDEIDENIVSAFNIDYNKMIEFFMINEILDKKDIYLYLMIERALSDYTSQIKISADDIAKGVVENIEITKVERHIDIINNFILSDKLKAALLIQKKDEKEHPEKYTTFCVDIFCEQNKIDIYTKRRKDVLQCLIDTLEMYVYFLQRYLKSK